MGTSKRHDLDSVPAGVQSAIVAVSEILLRKNLHQAGLFGKDAAPPAYRPEPDKVRARLHKILAEARAARKFPWEPARASLYRTIFPQMTNWLPEDEGAQLRFEFEAEMIQAAFELEEKEARQ